LARTLSAVDAVVVVSDYMQRSLVQAEPTLGARLHRITRPVREPTPRRRPLRQHPDDPTIIVCAGRITAEKGQAVVIEAAGVLRSRGPVELRIAGVIEDNAYWSHCQRLRTRATSRNPQLSVDYLGHLDYDAIDEVFADADIVTVPSQWPEPLGAVALEAMAAGSVVVASDIGGLADIITNDHNGIRVHPSDVTAWTSAIESLIDTPQHAWGLAHRATQHLAASTIDAHVLALDHIISTHQSPADSFR
jgi:1,4-alpha-glucan branching enzyme